MVDSCMRDAKGWLVPCAILKKHMPAGKFHTRVKGLVPGHYLTTSEGSLIRYKHVVYKSKADGNGYALKFCPWCGENILTKE